MPQKLRLHSKPEQRKTNPAHRNDRANHRRDGSNRCDSPCRWHDRLPPLCKGAKSVRPEAPNKGREALLGLNLAGCGCGDTAGNLAEITGIRACTQDVSRGDARCSIKYRLENPKNSDPTDLLSRA